MMIETAKFETREHGGVEEIGERDERVVKISGLRVRNVDQDGGYDDSLGDYRKLVETGKIDKSGERERAWKCG